MNRAHYLAAGIYAVALQGCAAVSFSDQPKVNALEYYTTVPALLVSLDADCKPTSQVISIPGLKRYMSFRSGLGKSATTVTFGPGGIVSVFGQTYEGQTKDALDVAAALKGFMRAAGPGGEKCKPGSAAYLIENVGGRPTVDSKRPLFAVDAKTAIEEAGKP